jgi:hypothetical protein
LKWHRRFAGVFLFQAFLTAKLNGETPVPLFFKKGSPGRR